MNQQQMDMPFPFEDGTGFDAGLTNFNLTPAMIFPAEVAQLGQLYSQTVDAGGISRQHLNQEARQAAVLQVQELRSEEIRRQLQVDRLQLLAQQLQLRREQLEDQLREQGLQQQQLLSFEQGMPMEIPMRWPQEVYPPKATAAVTASAEANMRQQAAAMAKSCVPPATRSPMEPWRLQTHDAQQAPPPSAKRGAGVRAQQGKAAGGRRAAQPKHPGHGSHPASSAGRSKMEQHVLEGVLQRLKDKDMSCAELLLAQYEQSSAGGQDASLYHMLLQRCATEGLLSQAVWVLQRMVSMNFEPSLVNYNMLLHACAKVGDMAAAHFWWNELQSQGLRPNIVTYNIVISLYARKKGSKMAEQWMHKLLEENLTPGRYTFGAVIDAFAREGKIEEAEGWARRMQASGIEMDRVIYNCLVNACATAGDLARAEYWFEQLTAAEIPPDEKTFSCLVHACGKQGLVDKAEAWFRRAISFNCALDMINYSTIINAHAKVGNVEQAEFWMEALLARGLQANIICYNTILHACAQGGQYQKAVVWKQRMKAAKLRPTTVTYNCLINAALQAGNGRAADGWLQEMVEEGIKPDGITSMYLRRRNKGKTGPKGDGSSASESSTEHGKGNKSKAKGKNSKRGKAGSHGKSTGSGSSRLAGAEGASTGGSSAQGTSNTPTQRDGDRTQASPPAYSYPAAAGGGPSPAQVPKPVHGQALTAPKTLTGQWSRQRSNYSGGTSTMSDIPAMPFEDPLSEMSCVLEDQPPHASQGLPWRLLSSEAAEAADTGHGAATAARHNVTQASASDDADLTTTDHYFVQF
eukprot:TRINITY_DN3140_c0_g1_i1.p1 TRINITY_DN3140_c0_g1~~TRINITY_DN3140_c0_g1_i1.p1  ORF type:complete len:805 (+),score=200.03 TRINITY_DN3140_c0_g1_i1:207-2621(+)